MRPRTRPGAEVAPRPKRRITGFVALGLLAVLGFALVTLPAAVVSGPLAKRGMTAVAYTGSLWSGQAAGFAWQGVALGDLSWTLSPLPLLRGRAAGQAQLTRPDGSLAAQYDVAFSGADVRLRDVRVALPVEALSGLPLGFARGWRGRAAGLIDEVALVNGWPVTLRGTLDLTDLVTPPPRNAPVGSYRAVFPHPQPQESLSVPADPQNITAQVRETSGPVSVDALLTLSRARNFAFEGTLAPRGEVPPSLDQALQLLGPADASGRRQFSVGGSL